MVIKYKMKKLISLLLTTFCLLAFLSSCGAEQGSYNNNFCTKCGATLSAADKFCGGCGIAVNAYSSSETTTTTGGSTTTTTTTTTSSSVTTTTAKKSPTTTSKPTTFTTKTPTTTTTTKAPKTTTTTAHTHSYLAPNYDKCWKCKEVRENYFFECSFGDTFIYDDTESKFEITIGNAASVIYVESGLYVDYCPTRYAVKVPIKIKNIGSSTSHLSYGFDYELFTSDGAEIISDSFFRVVYDTIELQSVRPDGTLNGYVYLNYTGDGNYVIEFTKTPTNQTTVILNVTK